MIIDDLDVMRIAVRPPETNPPLIIHSDTVLTGALAAQLLEVISRRNAKIFERTRRMDRNQFPEHHTVEIARKAPDWVA